MVIQPKPSTLVERPERVVGLAKQVLYRAVGKSTRTWQKLEDDVQMPILTPNTMLFGQPNIGPDENVDKIEDRDLRRQARSLNDCKRKIEIRWSNEYIRGLRERHNLEHHDTGTKQLNAEANGFRPKQDAATAARMRIADADQTDAENEEPLAEW
eukprot:gene14829-5946_t